MATRIPFTESQWEELENQALIFKYLAANVPVPPHLLFLVRRPYLFSSSSSSSSSSTLLSPHFGWNVYEMGLGRKIDTEPGRCRRTDGKKWRCSKEASSDSKYCERHMHRGKNRSSRKPLPPPLHPLQFTVSSTPNLSLDSSLSSSSRFQDTPSSSVLLVLTPMANTKLEPCYLLTLRVKRRSGYTDDFFSIEPSGSIKSCSGSAMEDDDGSCGYETVKQRDKQPDRHCFILGTDLGTRERPLMLDEKLKQREDQHYDDDEDEEEEQRSKRFYRFLDEWPSSKSSVSTTLFI